MTSEKQTEANRLNAEKSTGPRTDAGKQRSSLNALRHGLTGQVVLLPDEDIEAYNAFTAAIVTNFSVEGAIEAQLAHSYANFQWRINRVSTLEDNMFSLGLMEGVAENLNLEHPAVHVATSNAKTFRQTAGEFDKLSMYGQRLVNQSEKVLKQLKQLQEERRRTQREQMTEAILAYEAHVKVNAAFNPKENGFDFTVAQIESSRRRRQLWNPVFLAEEVRSGRVKAA